ncbi:MAG: hypothetical protein EBS00_02390 [Verrucomicrobia bacterium]|nr:hypothetical protein [Verrucomicrobiota bacterium]
MFDDPFLFFCGLVLFAIGIVALFIRWKNHRRAKEGKLFRSLAKESRRRTSRDGFPRRRFRSKRHRHGHRDSPDRFPTDFDDNKDDFLDYRG